MTIMETVKPSRRAILAGAGGLVIGVVLPLKSKAQSGAEAVLGGQGAAMTYAPNAFVRISPDNLVTVLIKHIEFGQGPFTGLATLVADEMDADWSQIRAEHAPADNTLYGNVMFGGTQGTGGSTAMASSYDVMRKAGAAAKAMLIAAAAQSWGVPAGEIKVSKGVLSHASGKTGSFGEFAEAAAAMEAPADPKLKTPDQFIYIGKTLPKLDTGAKSNGTAQFTLDVYREGMLTVVVAHPNKFGAKPASFDDKAAREVAGVVDVKQIGSGVAVYGRNTYAALKGRKALKVTWNDSAAEKRSSDAIMQERRDAVKKRGAVGGEKGTIDEATFSGANAIEAEYVFPYLAHAPMEPLDAVIERNAEGGVDVWMGSQIQTMDQATIAAVCKLEPKQVNLNTVLAGGSFGRRAQTQAQFAQEAAEVFMAAGGQTPVKLMWTREDDVKNAWLRPATVHRLDAKLDAEGNVTAMRHRVASPSILQFAFPNRWNPETGRDVLVMEGTESSDYAIPHFRSEQVITPRRSRVSAWRGIGWGPNCFARECFIDQLAEAAGSDPVAFRRNLLRESPRGLAVLNAVVEMSGFGDAPQGRAHGLSFAGYKQTRGAGVAEVSLEGGRLRVHRFWVAVDPGFAVHPENLRAQVEGGVLFGLSSLLRERATFTDGIIDQNNFYDYELIRIADIPEIEVRVVESGAAPSGAGEIGVPMTGAAVANGLRHLTGRAPDRIPFGENFS